MKNSLVICIMGPTASGKTDLALSLFENIPCEIISVDSAMVYRGMDIGTAKPLPDLLKSIPHHLIDIADPADTYSAGQFCRDVNKTIESILERERIPLLVGGTMLYFRAFQQGLSPLPQANADVRKKLLAEVKHLGLESIYQRLIAIDPVAAQRIDMNDKQRIQRAIEVYELTGKSVTDIYKTNQSLIPPYYFLNIALIPIDRQMLHERIVVRFKKMLKQGLVEEVEKLYRRGDLSPDVPALRSVGYRQIWAYLEDKLNADDMEEKSIIATRQLAKRQLTWIRSWQNISYFDCGKNDLFFKVLSFIKENKLS